MQTQVICLRSYAARQLQVEDLKQLAKNNMILPILALISTWAFLALEFTCRERA